MWQPETVSVFDGQTITVKNGTPVEFHFKGDPDFLTFYSGEAGKEYKYRERTTVDESEVETSTLKFKLTPQYGNPANILTMYVSSDFPGIEKGTLKPTPYWWSNTLGKHWSRLPIPYCNQSTRLCHRHEALFGQTYCHSHLLSAVKPTVWHKRDLLLATCRYWTKCPRDKETTFTAGSFGFTPINMLHRH